MGWTGGSCIPSWTLPEPDDGERLTAILDTRFERIADSFTPPEFAAMGEWQRSDRAYEAIQAALRGGRSNDETDLLIERIALAIGRLKLPEDAVLWRGIRDVRKAFGVDARDIGQLIGVRVPNPGFMATSTAREVALSEFTVPPLGGGPALIRLRVSPATRFAWVARLGDPRLRRQREVLMEDQTVMRVLTAEYHQGLAYVDAEVLP